MDNLKERHGCVTFWLWLASILNLAMAVFYASSMFSAYTSAMSLGFGLCSILGVVNVLGGILLMRWNKYGFYLFAVSCIISIIVNISILGIEPVAMISSLVGIFMWWGILQIRKNGVSAWSQMQSNWDYKHCRHIYQLFCSIMLVLFVVTCIAFGGNHNENLYAEQVFTNEETVVREEKEEDAEAAVVDSSCDSIAVDEVCDTVAVDEVKVEDVTEPEPVEELEPVRKLKERPSDNESTDDKIDKTEAFLRQSISTVSLPIDAGSGIMITKITIQDSYLMYIAECDEDLIDIDILNLNKKDVKEGITSTISDNSDPQIGYFVRLCIKAHKGIGFKYIGKESRKSCTVKVSYSELLQL